MRWSLTLGLLLNLAALVVAGAAHAQPGGDPRDEELADVEARALFNAGVAAYDAGRYEDALESFERAYQRSERPVLLYNIGQCYDRLRRDEEAVQAFERYLEAVPGAENRPQVEARLRALREAIARRSTTSGTDPALLSPAQVAASATPPPTSPEGPSLRESDSHRPRRIALVTTSVVVVVAVVVLSVVLAGGGGNDYVGSDVGTVFALQQVPR